MTSTPKGDKPARRSQPAKFDTPSARAKLKPQVNPYWLKLRINRFLGFRKYPRADGSAGPGTWSAKALVHGKPEFLQMKELDRFSEAERFDQATKIANAWFADLERTVVADVKLVDYTIHHALNEYLQAARENKLKKKAHDEEAAQGKADYTQRRFDLLVMPFVLERHAMKGLDLPQWVHQPMRELTRADYDEWRHWMVAQPTDPLRSGRGTHGGKRKVSTANRDLATFRAALNLAARTHGLPRTWAEALKQDHSVPHVKAVSRYKLISVADRRKLIDAARKIEPSFVPFLVAHCVVPVRPGGFAHMRVDAYDQRHNVLTVGRDKNNGDRELALPEEFKDVFAASVKDKLRTAYLFTDAKGQRWRADSWRRAFNRCRDAAGLDKRVTTYCLRHSRITDLIDANRPIAEIAALAGTSVDMIEKHYYQSSPEKQREALSVPGY